MMNQYAQTQPDDRKVEAALARELERGDLALSKIAPVLAHLLGNDDHSLFSDEVVARVRGMLGHMVRQLLFAEYEQTGGDDAHSFIARHAPPLEKRLNENSKMLAHCHALALEWQLCLKLEEEHGLDPVLAPLIQALVASDETHTAGLGIAGLAAQARFAQAQRRMELKLGELPAELFHACLVAWREEAGAARVASIDAAEAKLREEFDEGNSRVALFERLVVAMGKGVTAALAIEHAGVGLFLSALAAASEQSREEVTIATSERQAARLLLALRSTGLKAKAVEAQLVYLHGSINLPKDCTQISADRAASLLDDAWRPAR